MSNVRVARAVTAFPVPCTSSTRQPHGISVAVSGAGFTVARVLTELGTPVVFGTYVGADELGAVVAARLRRLGLYGATTQVCASQPRAMVLYDAAGTRSGCTDLRGTPDLHYPVEVFASAMTTQRPQMVVLGNIGFTAGLVDVAAQHGVPVAADVHDIDDPGSAHNQPWLRVASVLACSHERLPVTPVDWIRLLWRRYGTPLVLVGCGAGGAVLGHRDTRRIWRVAAVTPRGVRYTSGAGDTLLAGFVHHYLRTENPPLAAASAVLGAGWKVGALPDADATLSAELITALRRTHRPVVEVLQ